MINSYKKAFSLLELLVVLVIVGIVLAIGVPGVNRARADAELETMRARAVAMQTAKLAYVDAQGGAASAVWSGSDAQANYTALRPYLPSTYPPSLTDLFPAGGAFTLNLGAAAATAVSLTGPDATGATITIPLQKY